MPHDQPAPQAQRALLFPLPCLITTQHTGGSVAGGAGVRVAPLSALWARSSAFPAHSARGGAAGAEARNDVPASTALPAARPPPAWALPAAGGKVVPLFRAEALEARNAEEQDEGLPQMSTPGWVLLAVLVSVVAVLLGVGWFGRVEVTSTATGSLRVQSGPRPVLTQASGTVSLLRAAAGQRVAAGQPVLELAAAQLDAQQSKLSSQLSLLQEGQKRAQATSTELLARTLRALEQKRAILSQRLRLKRELISRLEQRDADIGTLVGEGAASITERLTARAALDAAREEALLLKQQVADVSIELLDRKRAHEAELLTRELDVRESEAALTEARALADLSVVTAPVTGRVESLLVAEGQVVPSGAVVARIVPEGEVSRAVVFVPSKEAAFVREGLEARLEFPSLPVSDFGRARARVVRVGSDVASSAEVAEVMEVPTSAADALVRVELVIEEDDVWHTMAPRLRSGARVTARLLTRERRVISLAFEFVRRWLPE
jgi:multidrug resistance efflux pump